jgi:hypothetical protein
MDADTGTILDEETPRARLSLLLQHVSQLDDAREPCPASLHTAALTGRA